MEISAFTIWLITTVCRLDGLLQVASVGGIILVLMATPAIFIAVTDFDVKINTTKWIATAKKIVVFCMIGIFMSCLVPTKKEFIAMYIIPPIARNEEIKQLPENVATFLNDYLTKETKGK